MVSQAEPLGGMNRPGPGDLFRVRAKGLWPRVSRDLWTDAMGLLCLLNLHAESGAAAYLAEAELVARDVDRILGRRRGISTAEGPEGGAQTFRALVMWIFALQRLGRLLPPYRHRALSLIREIHARFVQPGVGIIPRMEENLVRPLHDSGPVALDAYLGIAVYSQFGPGTLDAEKEELEGLIRQSLRSLAPDAQTDPGLLLWATHFFSGRPWAAVVRERSLTALDARWVDPPGYFRRNLPEPWSRAAKPNPLAISNYSAVIGLKAQGLWSERVARIHRHFLGYPAARGSSGHPLPGKVDHPLTMILASLSLHPGVMLAD